FCCVPSRSLILPSSSLCEGKQYIKFDFLLLAGACLVSIDRTMNHTSLLVLYARFGPIVSVEIKIAKHREHQHRLREPDARQHFWVATLVNDRHDGVKGEKCELPDLQLGQVSLPPEVRLQRRPERREEVVRIHNHVHQAVDADADHHLSFGAKREPDPAVPDDDAVMDDVESRHLSVLLAEHKEHGVHKLAHPNVEVPPARGQQSHGLLRHLEVDAGAQPAVVALEIGVAEEEDHEGHVDDHHGHVVEANDGLEFVRLPVLHPFGSLVLDEVDVEGQDHVDGNRVARVEPSHGPGVPGTG
ncbi:unnamed protein product, partial [Ixodes hexagonus]